MFDKDGLMKDSLLLFDSMLRSEKGCQLMILMRFTSVSMMGRGLIVEENGSEGFHSCSCQ
jgi:hypothetical protein